MTLERQINLKIWHDHSDILNHTYISFMVSFIYDHANFLTNEEFRETYPKKKPVDVQAVVERPNLYIFGQSGNGYYIMHMLTKKVSFFSKIQKLNPFSDDIS